MVLALLYYVQAKVRANWKKSRSLIWQLPVLGGNTDPCFYLAFPFAHCADYRRKFDRLRPRVKNKEYFPHELACPNFERYRNYPVLEVIPNLACGAFTRRPKSES